MKGLKKRFKIIRRLMIQCLDKCQIAVMTVVTLLTTIFEFDVRKAVSESYHRDISECKNNLELFGYLNLYWNYLSFNPLNLLLNKPVLKKYGDVLRVLGKSCMHTIEMSRILKRIQCCCPSETSMWFQLILTMNLFSKHLILKRYIHISVTA